MLDSNLSSQLNSLLLKEVMTGQNTHAYLLKGEGFSEQALLLAMALNCEDLQENGPCGLCRVCRQVKTGAFADLIEISPEKDLIRIEQIRKMQARANLGKIVGKKKIIIIYQADLLREEAANSLLKILEEPPLDTVFILAAANGDKLLPTVLSRCQVYQLGQNTTFAMDEENLQEMLPKARDFLKVLPGASCILPLNTAKSFDKDKDALLYMFLSLLQLLVREAKGLERLCYSPEKALTAALFVERSLSLLRRNISPKILADVVFLRLWKMANN